MTSSETGSASAQSVNTQTGSDPGDPAPAEDGAYSLFGEGDGLEQAGQGGSPVVVVRPAGQTNTRHRNPPATDPRPGPDGHASAEDSKTCLLGDYFELLAVALLTGVTD